MQQKNPWGDPARASFLVGLPLVASVYVLHGMPLPRHSLLPLVDSVVPDWYRTSLEPFGCHQNIGKKAGSENASTGNFTSSASPSKFGDSSGSGAGPGGERGAAGGSHSETSAATAGESAASGVAGASIASKGG
jgi:hypothetical protein